MVLSLHNGIEINKCLLNLMELNFLDIFNQYFTRVIVVNVIFYCNNHSEISMKDEVDTRLNNLL